MQTLAVTGNLGRDAEVSTTQSGKQLVKFSIASKGFKDTTWFNCVSFQERHINLAQYLTKGCVVSVSGELELKKVDDGKGYWVSVIVGNIGLHGGVKKNQSVSQEQTTTGDDNPFNTMDDDLSDDIPF
jgi:single-strand DNA-binding protein